MENPPPRPGRGAPVVQRLDPQTARKAQRLVLHFVLLILAALITASLPLPAQAAALLFAVAAIVVGLLALRVVWRPGLREPLAPVILLGLAVAALMVVSLSVMLALWQVQVERQECLARALTIGAREECEVQFEDSVERRLDEISRQPAG